MGPLDQGTTKLSAVREQTMRRIAVLVVTLAVGLLGCDSTEVPAPPGADEAETTLDVDMGGESSGEPAVDGANDGTPKKDE